MLYAKKNNLRRASLKRALFFRDRNVQKYEFNQKHLKTILLYVQIIIVRNWLYRTRFNQLEIAYLKLHFGCFYLKLTVKLLHVYKYIDLNTNLKISHWLQNGTGSGNQLKPYSLHYVSVNSVINSTIVFISPNNYAIIIIFVLNKTSLKEYFKNLQSFFGLILLDVRLMTNSS